MGLFSNLEREELFGGMRTLPVRALPAGLTVALLFLSGDMTGAWALAWVAMIPLCVGCRGAGPAGAFILATLTFFAAGFAQSYWLLDVQGAEPLMTWLAFAVIPSLAFLAIESPACVRLPWWTRPPLLAALSIGCWAALPASAEMLIPLGGLIDSEFLRPLYPKVGYATIAGLFTGAGWLVAELWWRGRTKPGGMTAGWPAWVIVISLLVLGAVDWTGVNFAPRQAGHEDAVTFHIAPGDDPVAQTRELFGDGKTGGTTIWGPVHVRDADEREAWVSRAGQLAARNKTRVVIMLSEPGRTTGYVLTRLPGPDHEKSWEGPAGNVEGAPLVVQGPGNLRLFPAARADRRWSTRWDYDVMLIVREPVHDAQVRGWVREFRRGAMIRGGRMVIIWKGGAVALDVDGQVAARSNGEALSISVPAGAVTGEAMGRARLTVVEDILAMGAPVVVLMLVLFTPLVFLRRRKRMATAGVAIEEVFDDQTTLSKEETERITRSIKPRD